MLRELSGGFAICDWQFAIVPMRWVRSVKKSVRAGVRNGDSEAQGAFWGARGGFVLDLRVVAAADEWRMVLRKLRGQEESQGSSLRIGALGWLRGGRAAMSGEWCVASEKHFPKSPFDSLRLLRFLRAVVRLAGFFFAF